MNSIPNVQNDPTQLHKLAAQRQLYGTAKRILAWQLILTGPIATLSALFAIAYPEARPFVAVWGVAITLLDLFWLSEWQKRKREQGAKAQESFDCDVLDLPWNPLKAGSKLDPEWVKEQSDAYQTWAARMPTLRDWYPVEFGQLPLHVARIACQRTNCWWDGKQRRHYGAVILSAIVVVLMLVLAAALFASVSYRDLVVVVLLPLAPMMVAGARQYREHTQTAERCDRLKEHANSIWTQALSGASAGRSKKACRELQDEIYEGRKRSPPVFDWMFRRLRNRYEGQMSFGAGELVAEAAAKLGLQSKRLDRYLSPY